MQGDSAPLQQTLLRLLHRHHGTKQDQPITGRQHQLGSGLQTLIATLHLLDPHLIERQLAHFTAYRPRLIVQQQGMEAFKQLICLQIAGTLIPQ